MANGIDMKLELPTDAELSKMFDAVPVLVRHKVADKAVRAGAKPIVKRARQLAPRSANTGSVKKWSKSMRESRNDPAPLWKTIAQVVRKGKQAGAISIVGPRHPDGNKAYFNTSPSGRVRKLWGKNPSVFSGRNLSTIAPQIRNWIVEAFDETKNEQLSKMKESLRKSMDGVWRE